MMEIPISIEEDPKDENYNTGTIIPINTIEEGHERFFGMPKGVAYFIYEPTKEQVGNTEKKYVVKYFNTDDSQTDARKEFEKVRTLNDLGIPVPEFHKLVRTDDNYFYIVYSDLTEDEKKQIFSTNDLDDEDSLSEIFSSDNNIQRVKEKIEEIYEIATANGVQLLEDAFFFVKDKERGEIEVVIGDFGLGISIYKEGDFYRRGVENNYKRTKDKLLTLINKKFKK